VLNRLRRRVAARRARAVVRAKVRASGVDVEALLVLARQSFVKLQAAWDAADMHALEACTTPTLLADLREQLRSRGGESNRTEVLALRAELLAVEEIREAYVASVEFSGLIREHVNRPEAPFRELWLLAHAKDAAPGWRIAGVQSLS
jgi:predicted lipid-binding transport protein (Tim44 family)